MRTEHTASAGAQHTERTASVGVQVMYTIGQRLIFLFPITAMWLVGPTAMVVTSVIVTTGAKNACSFAFQLL